MFPEDPNAPRADHPQHRIAKLELCIVDLRAALDRNADPMEGWNFVEDADAYEASRRLVPDRKYER